MWDRAREPTADWLMMVGGAMLLASLFLTWSHQFPASRQSVSGLNVALRGVPRNPTAWQVYSVADVLLALIAAGLVAVALRGRRAARAVVLVAAALGLAFAVHALAAPPTNGLDVVNPAAPQRGYIRGAYAGAGAGAGETVAVVGLALGVLGAGLALRTRDR